MIQFSKAKILIRLSRKYQLINQPCEVLRQLEGLLTSFIHYFPSKSVIFSNNATGSIGFDI